MFESTLSKEETRCATALLTALSSTTMASAMELSSELILAFQAANLIFGSSSHESLPRIT